MDLRSDQSIHLWIYNHPFYAISDQVEFFLLAMKQHGYAVSIGRRPRCDTLNVVIENFSEETRDTLIDFCRTSGKRVAVIMTEHIDLIDDQFYFHGNPLGTQSDYMTSGNQRSRIRYLMDCSQHIRCFLVLGDVPELRGISKMFPGISVRALPFPRLADLPLRAPARNGSITCDLVFNGYCTKYRQELLNLLDKEISVVSPRKWVSRRVRDIFNCSARIALNLPQRQDWKWLSLMRIIGALRCGKATVSLGTSDTTHISACCTQLDISKRNWLESLRHHVTNWQELYQHSLQCYTDMAGRFEQEKPFPHDLFDCWQITETTWSKRAAA